MNLKQFLENLLNSYKSTLKQTSLDDRGGKTSNYLCQDQTIEVYNFDKYVQDNFNGSLPASPDAIHVGNNTIYFIEFKNQPPHNIDPENIKNKFNSGTSILKNLLKEHLPTDVKFVFCVVYKSFPEEKYFNSMQITSNVARFGLMEANKNNGDFYSKIITQDVDFYKKSFKQLQCQY